MDDPDYGAHDDEPELAGYEPHPRRSRSARRQRMLRIIVIVGVLSLVLPGVLVGVATASRTADAACSLYVAGYVSGAVGFEARFELFAGGEPGWHCYAVAASGEQVRVASLGLIPGGVAPPPGRYSDVSELSS